MCSKFPLDLEMFENVNHQMHKKCHLNCQTPLAWVVDGIHALHQKCDLFQHAILYFQRGQSELTSMSSVSKDCVMIISKKFLELQKLLELNCTIG